MLACFFAGVLSSCNEDMYSVQEEDLSFSASSTIAPLLDTESLTSVNKIGDILNWAGDGDNRSVLAIQWANNPDSSSQPSAEDITFLAWGYYWNASDEPTGLDLIRAVAANDPRLFVVITEQWGGWTVKGFGYDANGDGEFSVSNSSITLTKANFNNGVYEGTASQSFDGMTVSSGDLWMGGWLDAYATYWVSRRSSESVPSRFDYSSVLVDGRNLENNSWDAWTFSSINTSEFNIEPQSELLKAAPANN